MAYKVKFKKKVNVSRVVAKVATIILVLYVGGILIQEVGAVMNNTYGPFHKGLSLIGWTVGVDPTYNATHYTQCGTTSTYITTATTQSCLTSYTTSTGILTVVGIIGIASIILEFVDFKLN